MCVWEVCRELMCAYRVGGELVALDPTRGTVIDTFFLLLHLFLLILILRLFIFLTRCVIAA